MIRSYGFMTTICPKMGIPRYGLTIEDMRDLHIWAKSPDMGLILMTSGISIDGHEGAR